MTATTQSKRPPWCLSASTKSGEETRNMHGYSGATRFAARLAIDMSAYGTTLRCHLGPGLGRYALRPVAARLEREVPGDKDDLIVVREDDDALDLTALSHRRSSSSRPPALVPALLCARITPALPLGARPEVQVCAAARHLNNTVAALRLRQRAKIVGPLLHDSAERFARGSQPIRLLTQPQTRQGQEIRQPQAQARDREEESLHGKLCGIDP
ncbi:predicted protein [Chaetomium globosum CBS 148.51]|uniref:Uncharacterized protein n=1 Tax=Chaetomium globosum (strain ATCC 6205 / CBS 148.51 / DSM 1962 / NBRC 6347 / NRRL 1970) TaxID=306901 RepID=Q2HF51_CHAGB|nr:uncharacterized protein CHGG_01153 [Chaetomium globosum CBS 148.51]EAQ92918.1 predicted protein [Chaetomium globosum CBS 148.51]